MSELRAIVRRKKMSGTAAIALLTMLRGPARVWKFSRGPGEIAGSTKAALMGRGLVCWDGNDSQWVALTDLGRAIAQDMLEAYRLLLDKTPKDGHLALWAAFAEADATQPMAIAGQAEP